MCTFYSLFCMNIGYDYVSAAAPSAPSSLLFNGATGTAAVRARIQLHPSVEHHRGDATAFSTLMTDMQIIPVAAPRSMLRASGDPVCVLRRTLQTVPAAASLVPGFEVEGMLTELLLPVLFQRRQPEQEPREQEAIETGKSLIDAEKRRLGQPRQRAPAALGATRNPVLTGRGTSRGLRGRHGHGRRRNPMVQVRAPV